MNHRIWHGFAVAFDVHERTVGMAGSGIHTCTPLASHGPATGAGPGFFSRRLPLVDTKAVNAAKV